jgi:hypothetical protein
MYSRQIEIEPELVSQSAKHAERFEINQSRLDAQLATDTLIGRDSEKIFQIRMQEIIAKYSRAEKFPSKIILPDTKARPMGLAIKDVFYYLADTNGFERPQVTFVATPKISQNNRPDSPRTIFDQYATIMSSQLAELKNTNVLDPEHNEFNPYTYELLTNQDRQNIQNNLLDIRSSLYSRMQELKINNASNILVIDDVSFNFTTLVEIGIAIRSLGVNAKMYFESIFHNGSQDSFYEQIDRCEVILGGLLGVEDMREKKLGYSGHFEWYRGNFKNTGIDENGKPIYAPHEMQRAIGVIKKPNELYSQKIENLSAKDKKNLRALRQRLKYIAGKALLDPMSEVQIEDFNYLL